MTRRTKFPPSNTVAWWASTPPAWEAIRAATYQRWLDDNVQGGGMSEADVLSALAFGYGAHQHYADVDSWELAAERIEQDWKTAGRAEEHPWSDPREAVAAGWRAFVDARTVDARTVDAPVAPPSADVAATAPELENLDARVPGGRPDHPHGPERRPPPAAETQDRVPGGRMDGRRT